MQNGTRFAGAHPVRPAALPSKCSFCAYKCHKKAQLVMFMPAHAWKCYLFAIKCTQIAPTMPMPPQKLGDLDNPSDEGV
jgi:hypothetical protein